MSSSMLGLDRKAMEAERQKRLAMKRGASEATEIERPGKIAKTESSGFNDKILRTISPPPIPRQRAPNILEPRPTTEATVIDPPPLPKVNVLQFPTGVFKKTWVYGQSRVNDIKIEEVLQKNTLRIALLSSFQWNMEWVFSKLDVPRTKLVLVMQAKDEETVSKDVVSDNCG